MPPSTGETQQAPSPPAPGWALLGPLGGHSDAGGWPQWVRVHAAASPGPVCAPRTAQMPRAPAPCRAGGRLPGLCSASQGTRGPLCFPKQPSGTLPDGPQEKADDRALWQGPAARCHTLQGVRACGQRGRPSAGCGKEGTGGNGLGSSPSGFQVILFKSEFTPGFYLSAASGPQGGAPWQSLAFTVPAQGPAEAEGLAQHAGLPRVMKGGVTRDSPPTRRVYPGTLSSGPGAEQATERVACWGPGPPCPSCHLLQMPRPAGGPPED